MAEIIEEMEINLLIISLYLSFQLYRPPTSEPLCGHLFSFSVLMYVILDFASGVMMLRNGSKIKKKESVDNLDNME